MFSLWFGASLRRIERTFMIDLATWSEVLLLNCISKQLLYLWSKDIVYNGNRNSWPGRYMMVHDLVGLPRIAVTVIHDAFSSQMQQLLGNAVQEKDLGPPRFILEVRSILRMDAPDHKNNTFYYWTYVNMTYLHRLNSKTCFPYDLEHPYEELNGLSWLI